MRFGAAALVLSEASELITGYLLYPPERKQMTDRLGIWHGVILSVSNYSSEIADIVFLSLPGLLQYLSGFRRIGEWIKPVFHLKAKVFGIMWKQTS